MYHLYVQAREQGRYEALGGHRARASLTLHTNEGRSICTICGRPLTWNEERHAPTRRRRVTR